MTRHDDAANPGGRIPPGIRRARPPESVYEKGQAGGKGTGSGAGTTQGPVPFPGAFPGEKGDRHGASLRASPPSRLGFPFSYTL